MEQSGQPTVVYLPGLDGSPPAGERVFSALSDCNTFQFTYPLASRADMTALSDALVAELRARGFSRVTLIGESFGGALAQMTASRQSELVERVILLASFHRHPAPMSGALAGFALRHLPPWLIKPFIKLVAWFKLARGMDAEGRQKFYERVFSMPLHDIGWRLWALRGFDARKLTSWKQPTLWIWGERDKLMRIDGARAWLAQHRPNDAVAIIPSAGHLIPYTGFESMVTNIRAFLRLPPQPPHVSPSSAAARA